MTSNHHHHVLYPSQWFTSTRRCRAVTLISTALSTNSWMQIPFPSMDVVVVQISSPSQTCTIFNIYNVCDNNNTLQTLEKYLEDNLNHIRSTGNDHMIWLGDFNWNHPLWEEEQNVHLLTTKYLETAQPLIELVGDYAMVMTLPKNTPTLEALAMKNWTRPDNIFCSEHTIGLITKCNTDPTNRGPHMDHVPILTTLDIPTQLCPPVITRNYNDVKWGEFNDTLCMKLAEFPLYTPIVTDIKFQATARNLTHIIEEMIEEHVPLSKPSTLSKRWWNHDLTKMKQAASMLTNQAYKLEGATQTPHP